MKVILATHNKHKIDEIKDVFNDDEANLLKINLKNPATPALTREPDALKPTKAEEERKPEQISHSEK